MKEYIVARVYEHADYILNENCTVRSCGKKFSVSKSTVHKDVTERLEALNPQLAENVRNVLEINLEQRHLRGGTATKNKYLLNRPS